MNCCICKQNCGRGRFLVFSVGWCCSEDCGQIAFSRREALHDSLYKEPLAKMPKKLETADFERWALKFAVHWLRDLGDVGRAQLVEINIALLDPMHCANEFKSRILRHIPKCYVSDVKLTGHDRMLNDGVYCFRQAVPQEVMIAAAQKAQLLRGKEIA